VGFLAILPTASSVYGQVSRYERIDGATSPHLIANYYGWDRLFWRADEAYRLGSGYYHNYVFDTLRLGQLLPEQHALRPEFLRIFLDEATAAAREADRYNHDREGVNTMFAKGLISGDSVAKENTKILKEQVASMRSYRNSFRDKVKALDPVLGPRLVEAVDSSIDKVIKRDMSLTRWGDDIDQITAILREFDSK
jgi:hypothetical protein